jgi:membrane-associated phospholipid phosphatase
MKRPSEMPAANIPGESPVRRYGAWLSCESRISRWLAEVGRACGPFEWITFAYLAWLNALVSLFHRSVSHPFRHVAVQCAIVGGIAVLIRSSRNRNRGILHFARHWYPLPLYIFFFEELQGLVHAIFTNWFDGALTAFDHALFGVHPSVWLAQFANPQLNDFMQFFYMTYFLYLVMLPALLYFSREYNAFWSVMVSTAIAHYSVYVISVLLPIESPYYSLASVNKTPLVGGYFTDLIGLVERFGRVHGAAFPSAHVAGSMVAILAAWRYRRSLFWLCLPFFGCMCVATVYGRYHYAADVFAGLVVGALGFRAGMKLTGRKNISSADSLKNPFLAPQVSHRAQIGNQENETILALVSNCAERKAPIFDA